VSRKILIDGVVSAQHPLYHTWANMIQRCTNPKLHNYKNYGGRGISVCEEWRTSFVSFVRDMGPRPSAQHSIDRKENDGNYEPGNCVWATPAQQAANKRKGVQRVSIGQETKPLKDWAARAGVTVDCISQRISRGLTGVHLVAPRWTERTNGMRITLGGETLTVRECCKRAGIARRTFYERIARGESGPELLRAPGTNWERKVGRAA